MPQNFGMLFVDWLAENMTPSMTPYKMLLDVSDLSVSEEIF
jgi:hypothetical protein